MNAKPIAIALTALCIVACSGSKDDDPLTQREAEVREVRATLFATPPDGVRTGEAVLVRIVAVYDNGLERDIAGDPDTQLSISPAELAGVNGLASESGVPVVVLATFASGAVELTATTSRANRRRSSGKVGFEILAPEIESLWIAEHAPSISVSETMKLTIFARFTDGERELEDGFECATQSSLTAEVDPTRCELTATAPGPATVCASVLDPPLAACTTVEVLADRNICASVEGSFEGESCGSWIVLGRPVWECGAPDTGGPERCASGNGCAATNLRGTYPPSADSTLVSAAIELPRVSGPEGVYLQYEAWFSYGCADFGNVAVQVWMPELATWSDWSQAGGLVRGTSGNRWVRRTVELTDLAPNIVRVAFQHHATDGPCPDGAALASEGFGWYVDDVTVVCR